MLADEPLTTYKTGSNLVRAIDASTTNLDSTRNSISTRLQKNREPNRSDRQLELKTNVRSGMSSSRDDNQRRRKRRRMRHLKQRCRHGDSEACHKLKRLVQKQGQNVPELFEDDQIDNMDDDIFNSDLVRSLDRRSSKQRRQRRKNNKKNKKVETDEELRRRRERKAKKQQEKEERRRKRKDGQQQRRLLNRQRRKEMREKKRREEEESNASVSVEKRHTLRRVRSVTPSPDSGKCQVKLIETCAFPHCNPSCPKLKNPETGKHIFY